MDVSPFFLFIRRFIKIGRIIMNKVDQVNKSIHHYEHGKYLTVNLSFRLKSSTPKFILDFFEVMVNKNTAFALSPAFYNLFNEIIPDSEDVMSIPNFFLGTDYSGGSKYSYTTNLPNNGDDLGGYSEIMSVANVKGVKLDTLLNFLSFISQWMYGLKDDLCIGVLGQPYAKRESVIVYVEMYNQFRLFEGKVLYYVDNEEGGYNFPIDQYLCNREGIDAKIITYDQYKAAFMSNPDFDNKLLGLVVEKDPVEEIETLEETVTKIRKITDGPIDDSLEGSITCEEIAIELSPNHIHINNLRDLDPNWIGTILNYLDNNEVLEKYRFKNIPILIKYLIDNNLAASVIFMNLPGHIFLFDEVIDLVKEGVQQRLVDFVTRTNDTGGRTMSIDNCRKLYEIIR